MKCLCFYTIRDNTFTFFFFSLKSGLMTIPSLSPPNSPNSTATLSNDDSTLTESVFESGCFAVDSLEGIDRAESLEGIDRAEMNRYLCPDQSLYSQHQQHTGLSASPSISPHALSVTSSPHTLSSSPLTSVPSLLTYQSTLQPLPSSRVLGPPPLYSSPTYGSVGSPVLNNGSPDTLDARNSSSPPPPHGDLIELQPLRRDGPLPSLTSHKNVNQFLANNICYSQSSPYYQYASYAGIWQ